MSGKIFVPCDSAALSVGADAVARAIAEQIAARHLDLVVVRNGSRGLFWLEPMVEVETPKGRVAYGPVTSVGLSRGQVRPLTGEELRALRKLAGISADD